MQENEQQQLPMLKEIMAQIAYFCETDGSVVTIMQREITKCGPALIQDTHHHSGITPSVLDVLGVTYTFYF